MVIECLRADHIDMRDASTGDQRNEPGHRAPLDVGRQDIVHLGQSLLGQTSARHSCSLLTLSCCC
jgi:hypothetical protein